MVAGEGANGELHRRGVACDEVLDNPAKARNVVSELDSHGVGEAGGRHVRSVGPELLPKSVLKSGHLFLEQSYVCLCSIEPRLSPAAVFDLRGVEAEKVVRVVDDGCGVGSVVAAQKAAPDLECPLVHPAHVTTLRQPAGRGCGSRRSAVGTATPTARTGAPLGLTAGASAEPGESFGPPRAVR